MPKDIHSLQGSVWICHNKEEFEDKTVLYLAQVGSGIFSFICIDSGNRLHDNPLDYYQTVEYIKEMKLVKIMNMAEFKVKKPLSYRVLYGN